MATLAFNLPVSPHRAVFRAIVQTLRQDDTLSRVIRVWQVMDGSPIDWNAMGPTQLPGCRLLPSEGPDAFYGPGGMIGPLQVRVELWMLGSDFDDPLDLWHAFRRAIYPKTDSERFRIHNQLVAAGAEAMFVTEFSQLLQPTIDIDGPIISAAGMIQVRVRSDLNP